MSSRRWASAFWKKRPFLQSPEMDTQTQIWTSPAKTYHRAELKWNLDSSSKYSYSSKSINIGFLQWSLMAPFPLHHLNLRTVWLIEDYFKIGQQRFCHITGSRHHQAPFPASWSMCILMQQQRSTTSWDCPHTTEPNCHFCSFAEDKKMWGTMTSNLCSECAICPQMNWDIVATRHENDGKWGWEKERVRSDWSACCDISPFNLSGKGLHIILHKASLMLDISSFTSLTFDLHQLHKVELIETYEGTSCAAHEPKRITFTFMQQTNKQKAADCSWDGGWRESDICWTDDELQA